MSFQKCEENIDYEIAYKPYTINKIFEILRFGIFISRYPKCKSNLRIFGIIFVKNNLNKCKIIYKDKEYELKEYLFEIDKNYNHD